jgi:hypothetical protein
VSAQKAPTDNQGQAEAKDNNLPGFRKPPGLHPAERERGHEYNLHACDDHPVRSRVGRIGVPHGFPGSTKNAILRPESPDHDGPENKSEGKGKGEWSHRIPGGLAIVCAISNQPQPVDSMCRNTLFEMNLYMRSMSRPNNATPRAAYKNDNLSGAEERGVE